MKKGIYSVPVRLQSNQDKGSTDGLESPNFVQSKEHMLTDAQEKLENSFKVENQQEFIKNHFNKDMTVFMDNLENKKVFIYTGNAFYSWQCVFRSIEIFKLIKLG